MAGEKPGFEWNVPEDRDADAAARAVVGARRICTGRCGGQVGGKVATKAHTRTPRAGRPLMWK